MNVFFAANLSTQTTMHPGCGGSNISQGNGQLLISDGRFIHTCKKGCVGFNTPVRLDFHSCGSFPQTILSVSDVQYSIFTVFPYHLRQLKLIKCCATTVTAPAAVNDVSW